jgi:uncharacterized membrane protein YebE (DUF533 family)
VEEAEKKFLHGLAGLLQISDTQKTEIEKRFEE